MVGSFATTLNRLSASSVGSLHALLCAEPLLANYLNACVICDVQCPVKISAVIAVEDIGDGGEAARPHVEEVACHTYVTLFAVSARLSDSQAAKICSSLDNGVNFLQRNAWGMDGQRVVIMALGGQHKVNLSRIYSDEGTSQARIDNAATALIKAPLLRGMTQLQHDTLSLSPVAEGKFIVCFSFHDSSALQQRMKAMASTSLRLMDVRVYAADDICVPRNL